MKKWDQRSGSMALVAALWLALALWCWLRPSDGVSAAERRELAQFPHLSGESLLDGSFMTDFESYTQDQFPLRQSFRGLKALTHYNLLGQQDNNGIYIAQGQAAKIEYPLSEKSVDNAVGVLKKLYESKFPGSRVFAAVVPDKGYYLAQSSGYPAMDYEKLVEKVREGWQFASYVNLTDTLKADDYYRTDTHWRQERLLPAARKLCDALDIPAPEGLTEVTAEQPFYGVYYGQAALPMKPDTLRYWESPLLSACRVYNHETGKYGSIYDKQKLEGDDLYEVFLSGPVSLLTVENPNAETDRELILFRDSFGSSLAPLLVQGYKSVTLVDLRYVSSVMLDRFIDFHGQDVLFLYSTLVLNNSQQIR